MAIDTPQKRRRSLNSVLHNVQAPIDPFPYDGTLEIDRAHIAGYYLPAAKLRSDFTVLYAVELKPAFDKRYYGEDDKPTATEIGLREGTFRWITGRPGFDGSQDDVFYEKGDMLNTDRWFEGILIKEGLSNPSRRIDIKDSGDYATLNGFDFTLRNDEFFWHKLEEKKIYIANSSIKVYVVLDRTFYSLWQGVVSGTSYTETEFKINCDSSFKVLHNQFPPEMVTAASYPQVNEKAIGEVIPVCLGDIPYAKGLNISGPVKEFTVVKQGQKEFKICAAASYVKKKLQLKNDNVNFTKDALFGKYLRVIRGNSEDFYRIIGNGDTKNNLTEIILEHELENWEDKFLYRLDGQVVPENVWYFQIISAPVEYIVSHKKIKKFVKAIDRIMAFNYDDEYQAVDYAVLDHTNTEIADYEGSSKFVTISEKSSARSRDFEKKMVPGYSVDTRIVDSDRRNFIQYIDDKNSLLNVEFDLDITSCINVVTGENLLEWADEFHLAVDMDYLFYTEQTSGWSFQVLALLKDPYGNNIEQDLLQRDDSKFQLSNLPISQSYYHLNLIDNDYYFYYYWGYRFQNNDDDSFWPSKGADDVFTPAINFDTVNKTLLNQDLLDEIYSDETFDDGKIRLVVRVEAQNVNDENRLSFGLEVNIKEICFFNKSGWENGKVTEILNSETSIVRGELFDQRRLRNNFPYKPSTGQNFVEIEYDVEIPSGVGSSDTNHLCIDMDVQCHGDNVTWNLSCKAFRIKAEDQLPDETDLFKNGLDIGPFRASGFSVLNFLPDFYYEEDQRNNQQSLWPVGSIGTDTSTKIVAAKQMSLLDPEKMELVIQNGLTKTIRMVIKVQKGRNDKVVLRIKQVGLIAVKKSEFSEDEVYVRCEGEVARKVKIAEPDVVVDICTNSVFGAFVHILRNYDQLPYEDVNFSNLHLFRNTDSWRVGRQIVEQKNSFDYLKELCKQSFVGMFPSRDGVLTLNAWLHQSNNNLPIFNEDTIIRDSIKNYTKTKPQELYNQFQISYAYNPGSDSFDKVLFVTNSQKEKFPPIHQLMDGRVINLENNGKVLATKSENSNEVILNIEDLQILKNPFSFGLFENCLVSFEGSVGTLEPGISFYQGKVIKIDKTLRQIKIIVNDSFYQNTPELKEVYTGKLMTYGVPFDEKIQVKRAWTSFVGGFTYTEDDEASVYQLAKGFWDRCRESYLYTNGIQQAPDSLTTLKWYIDDKFFGKSKGAVNYLHNLIDWTSRPKAQVEFKIPVNGYMFFGNGAPKRRRNLQLELLEKVVFNDEIYTKGEDRFGWVTKIEPDTKKGEIKVALILEVDDYSSIIIERGIPENDPMPWIIENGIRESVIAESGE